MRSDSLLGVGDGGADGVLGRLAGLAQRVVPRIEVLPILRDIVRHSGAICARDRGDRADGL